MNCGLLGRKLGHSYSPAIHAILADYEYRLYEKEPEELAEFLQDGPWQGLNVTIPYKKDVVKYCTALSPLAAELGSVNTLVRRPDGTIFGDNTDAWGFEVMVRRLGVDCRGKLHPVHLHLQEPGDLPRLQPHLHHADHGPQARRPV